MARLQGGKEVITQPQYDSVSIPTGTTSAVLFQGPLGSGTSIWAAAGVKVFADTNMNLAGQFSSGWEFELFTVQFLPQVAVALADLKNLLAAGALEIVIGAKTFLQVPLVFCCGGGGAYGAASNTNAATTTILSNGLPDPKNVFALGDRPITIEQNENFFVRLVWAALTLTATVKARVILGGRLSRGIQ